MTNRFYGSQDPDVSGVIDRLEDSFSTFLPVQRNYSWSEDVCQLPGAVLCVPAVEKDETLPLSMHTLY